MANTFKNAFKEIVSYCCGEVVFRVASSTTAILIGLQLTNTGNSEITATITLRDSSTSSNDLVLINAVAIPANSLVSVLVGDKVVLEATDI